MQLPVIGFVGCGDDLQTIVKVGAKSIHTYNERLDYLVEVLSKKDYDVTCNPNPDGFIRMPGTNDQHFIPSSDSTISWDEWKTFSEELIDALPPIVSLSDYAANPPERPEALIEGVLRRGHKMIISGPSKCGKSFLLMALCIAIAEGLPWLGFM